MRQSCCVFLGILSGVDALVKLSQMTVSPMNIQNTTASPQQRQHWLNEVRKS
jgi:hypothetical protein